MKREIIVVGDAAYVQLTKGYVAVIDAADVPLAGTCAWQALIARRPDGSIRTIYAHQKRAGKTTWLHRIVLAAPEGFDVDHIDGNGLDCRRRNLRPATKSQNSQNQRTRTNNTSGVKGVHWHARTGKWVARIAKDHKRQSLGYFDAIEDAATAYACASATVHGEFSRPT